MTSSESFPPELPRPLPARERKRLRGCLIVLGVLGFLTILGLLGVFLFAYTEAKRAERDWNEFVTHWEAKGELFDLEKLIPPEIPDGENFAKAPIIAELFDESKISRLAKLKLEEIPGLRKPSAPLLDSQRALGAPRHKLSSYLENPELASSEKEAARIILEALEPLEPIFYELHEASQRPKARFPLNYNRLAAIQYEHLKPLNQSLGILELRTQALITLELLVEARKDLTTMSRLANLLGSEPTLISHLVEITARQKLLRSIWELLNTKSLPTSDLAWLDTILEKQEFDLRLVRSLRTERATMLATFEEIWSETPRFGLGQGDYGELARKVRKIPFGNTFRHRSKLLYAKFLQEHGLSENGNPAFDRLNLDSFLQTKADLLRMKTHPVLRINPYGILPSMPIPAYFKVIQSSFQTSIRIDLARVAIALELYRREHGGYPATLAPLTPAYIDSAPPDLITGDPLHYLIKPDGTPLIYSVGLNKIDEGGLLKRDRALGDWVWQYTLPADFDEKDWRE